MHSSPHPLVYIFLVVFTCVAFLFAAFILPAFGHEHETDPEIKAWYRSLKQNDSPLSCCGESDSYFCSEHSRGSQVYCVIEDDRDVPGRTRVPNGTEINIPANKINRDANMVGRAIVFLSSGGMVWCFIGAGGV